MMNEVLVAGAGKVGKLVAELLAQTRDYRVHLVDISVESISLEDVTTPNPQSTQASFDVTDPNLFSEYVKKHHITTIISCLPYFSNISLARLAKDLALNYFDVTEDVDVTHEIKKLAKGAQKVFVPQCGIAPGYISIATNELIKRFDNVESVLMRGGALPVHPNNMLKYAITWSIDGLINQYGNPCFGIVDGKSQVLQPLEGLETIEIDGYDYEAFNTSGGLGTMVESLEGKVKTLNYKSVRYRGHCEYLRLLMNELKLNHDRATLKRILENALPKTQEDVVILYVAVTGYKQGSLQEETYVKKIYPQTINGRLWSAIQVSTAASVCAIVDIIMKNPEKYQGLILQESFDLTEFLNNRFGTYYNIEGKNGFS